MITADIAPSKQTRTEYLNTLPNWRLTEEEYEEESRGLSKRIRQIPDAESAARAWNRYVDDLQRQNIPVEVSVSQFAPGFPKLYRTDVEQTVPDRVWFPITNKETGETHAESVHGRPHVSRVGLYGKLLGFKENLTVEEQQIIDATSLVHDLGRENDTLDPNHGLRSVEIWRSNPRLLESHGIYVKDSARKTIEILSQYHEVPYNKIPLHIRAKHHKLLRIFKAADALDRYRASNEKWHPDLKQIKDRKIRKLVSDLMPFARYFTLATEYYRTHYEPDVLESHLAIARYIGLALNPEEEFEARQKQTLLRRSTAE
jgi:hypothetical protein